MYPFTWPITITAVALVVAACAPRPAQVVESANTRVDLSMPLTYDSGSDPFGFPFVHRP